MARKLVSAGYALFGAACYFARRGEPPGPIADLAGHEIICYGGNFPWQPGAAWLARSAASARRVLTTNNVHGVTEAVSAGFGLALLPCFVGEARGLIQLSSPLDRDDVYVAFAVDMQNVPRVRAVIDAIVDAVRTDLERLQGRTLDAPRSAAPAPRQTR